MPDAWGPRLWLLLASIAGGITALSFRAWKEMTAREMAFSVFVSTSFGVFVAPWIISALWSHPTLQTATGITWVMASGSNILIPMAIRWIGRAFPQGDKA